jgi:toxin ParE1/3/4
MKSKEPRRKKELFVAPTAQSDLLAIWDYIAADSPDSADRMGDRFWEAFHQLQKYPESGRSSSGLAGTRRLRFWRVGEYQVVYRVTKTMVEIAAILHGSRDIPAVLREREPGE